MQIFLIPLNFIVILFILTKIKKIEWRYSFALTSLTMAFIIILITEALSNINLFTFNQITYSWIVILVLCSFYIMTSYRSINHNSLHFLKHIKTYIKNNKIIATYLTIVILLTAVLSLYAPPNTYDSMTYHMSRVAHWIQNSTVDFYSTSIYRQIVSAPFSEYTIANLTILANSDRYANFVQWFSMVGSLIVVSKITSQIGGSSYSQILSSLICASIPMGILQSSSTQNDYLVGFWILIFVYVTLKWIKKQDLLSSIAIGVSFGLSILTKPTAYIFTLPFVIYLAIYTLRSITKEKNSYLLLSLLIIIGINSNHWLRNYQSFNTPIAQSLDSGHYSYENEVISIKTTISNILRNAGLHLENGNRFDRLFQRSIEKGHQLFDIDINDIKTTWPEYNFKIQGNLIHEDYAGNYYHTLLIVFSLIIYFIYMPKKLEATIYISLVASAYLIFCSFLRWQPWHSRLQLPLFLLWCPFLGLVVCFLSRCTVKDVIEIKLPLLSEKYKFISIVSNFFHHLKISNLIIFILIYSSIQFLFLSASKPIYRNENIFNTPRDFQLFTANSLFRESYFKVAQLIKSSNCKKIGLLEFADDMEYPIWLLVDDGSKNKVIIEHINTNYKIINKKLISNINEFVPCAIISSNRNTNKDIIYKNNNYSINFSTEYLKLYLLN